MYKQEYKQELQQFQIEKLMNENADLKITIEGHLRAEVMYKKDIAYWKEEYEDLKEYLAYLKKENNDLRANCDELERLLNKNQARDVANRKRLAEDDLMAHLDLSIAKVEEFDIMKEVEAQREEDGVNNVKEKMEPVVKLPLKLYEPENEGEYQNYVRNNHLCLRNFCKHYNICDVSKEGLQVVPIFCKSGNHPGKHWHWDEMRRQFPKGYSKCAALCQVSRSFKSRYPPVVVAQLLASLEKDEDGYFSTSVGPTRFKE